ncbi:MAG: hypothetical protein M3Y81_16065 [Chloroflexota bacterium]|nr:hypothetical protein [Chloroflexota bacterium]
MKRQLKRGADRCPAPPVGERVVWVRERFLPWFERCGRAFPWREAGRTAYEVVVAEILLQRTTANAVARAYTPFLTRYPSWLSLGQATREELRGILRPLGLWRQKADVLLSLAHSVEGGSGSRASARPPPVRHWRWSTARRAAHRREHRSGPGPVFRLPTSPHSWRPAPARAR